MFRSVDGGFYKQTVFPIMDNNLPKELKYLFNEENRDLIRTYAEQIFETPMNSDFVVTSHRLLPSEQIQIHNDYVKDPYSIKYGFTNRIIVYINDQSYLFHILAETS